MALLSRNWQLHTTRPHMHFKAHTWKTHASCLSRYRNTSPNTKTLSSCLERAKYDVLKFHPMPSSSLCAHTRTQSGAHRNIHSLATQHVSVTQAQHTCHTLYPPAWTGSQPWAHCVYVYDGLSPRHWVDSRCPDCQAADCAMPWAIWSDLANDVVSGLLYSNTHACSAHKRYTETEKLRYLYLKPPCTYAHTHYQWPWLWQWHTHMYEKQSLQASLTEMSEYTEQARIGKAHMDSLLNSLRLQPEPKGVL
jgi:hypothetical protein